MSKNWFWKKKDAAIFVEKLRSANAKLKADREAEEARKEREIFEKQCKVLEMAKAAYLEKFLEKHIEYIDDKLGFYRLMEDYQTYAKKPWYVYVDFEEEVSEMTLEQLEKDGWDIGTCDDGKTFIYPVVMPKIPWWKRLWNWIKNKFQKAEPVKFENADDEETFDEGDVFARSAHDTNL